MKIVKNKFHFIYKPVCVLLLAFSTISMAHASRTITPALTIDVMYEFLSCTVYGAGKGYLGRNDDRTSIARYVEFSIPPDVVPANTDAKLNLFINASSTVRWMYIKQVVITTPACSISFYNDLFDGTVYYSNDVSMINVASIPSSAIIPGGKLRIGLSTITAGSPPLKYFDYLVGGVTNLVLYDKAGDDDGDGVLNGSDNCPSNANANQQDSDSDGLGDVCDTDDDNDGVLDINDAFPLDATESIDTDNDSIGNNADWDDDNDGVPDTVDAAPLNAADTSEITLPLNGVYKGAILQSSEFAQ